MLVRKCITVGTGATSCMACSLVWFWLNLPRTFLFLFLFLVSSRSSARRDSWQRAHRSKPIAVDEQSAHVKRRPRMG